MPSQQREQARTRLFCEKNAAVMFISICLDFCSQAFLEGVSLLPSSVFISVHYYRSRLSCVAPLPSK